MSGRQYMLVIEECGRPLLSNSRLGVYANAREVKMWRQAGCVLARAQRIPRLGRVAVAAWGRYPTSTVPDTGGIAPSLKAVLDGIVDAGVLPDDKAPFVASEAYFSPIVDRGKPPALVVVLTEIGEEDQRPKVAA